MDGIKGRLFIIALFSIHSELLTKEDGVKVLQVVDDAVASEFVKKIIGAMARAARVGMQKPNEQQTTSSAERTDGDRSGYELPEELKGLFVVYNKLVQFIRDTPHNCAQTIHVIPADQNFEKKCNSNALFAREISLVTQPSFDCEQGINSQVQTVCSNADAVFPVLGIVFCKNERFSLSRKTHVPLWNEPMISHVRLP